MRFSLFATRSVLCH